MEARFDSKAPAPKSKPHPVQRTKAGTLARWALGGADTSGEGRSQLAAEGGAGTPLASSREDVPQRRLSITLPRPTSARPRASSSPSPGRAGSERALSPVTFRLGEGRGKWKRALASCVLAYVAGVRLRPSRRPPVAAAAAAAVLSLCPPPPEGGWGRGQPSLPLPGCRGCTSAA